MKNTYLQILVIIGLLMIMNSGVVDSDTPSDPEPEGLGITKTHRGKTPQAVNRMTALAINDSDHECSCERESVEPKKETDYEIEEVKALYSEFIKMNIMEALDLPYNIANNESEPLMDLPSFLLPEQSSNDEYLSYDEHGHTRHRRTERLISRIVLPAIGGGVLSGCFRFRIPRYMPAKKIKSASLWIFNKQLQEKQQDRKKKYVVISTTNKRFKNYETSNVLLSNSSWIYFDVTSLVSYLLLSKQRYVDFNATICCFTDSSRNSYKRNPTNLPLTGSHRPRLDIKSQLKVTRTRTRRDGNLMCPVNVTTVTCCREKLYINLTELTYIHYPEGYRADYCRGSCIPATSSRNFASDNLYGHMLYLHSIAQGIDYFTFGCCVSTRTEGISIAYYTKDLNFIHEYLPRMIVDECNCKI